MVLISGTTPDPAGALINEQHDATGAVVLLTRALAGGIIAFKAMRFTSPYFLGALGVCATETIFGLPVSLPPIG